MVWIDYAILAIISLSTVISLVRGFAKEAVSLIIWIMAFFVASYYYPYLATYFTELQDALVRNAVSIAVEMCKICSLVWYFLAKSTALDEER